MSLIEWRKSVIKDFPICRNCKEKTTGIDESMIIIGVDTDNGKVNNGFYSEHKQCKPIIKTFTRSNNE